MNKNAAQLDPEFFWDALLSREDALIRRAFEELTAEEREAVLKHLKRMASEPGWHPEQRESASKALAVVGEKLD